MSKEYFRITYDGEALANHEMDVRILMPALQAISDLFEKANELLNPNGEKITVNVHGSLRTGSIGIDLSVVQSIAEQLSTLFTSKEYITAKELVEIVGFGTVTYCAAKHSLISVLGWLKGKPITSVKPLEDGIIRIYQDEKYIDIEHRVYELLENYKVRKSVEEMLDPLAEEGIDTFAVGTDSEINTTITKSQRSYFIAPSPSDEDLGDVFVTKNLQIERIEFGDDNKWRFNDGNNSFYASIKDEEFIKDINDGVVSFGKGDIIHAKIKESQKLSVEKLKTEYTIEKVLKHRRAHQQVKLL